MKKSIVIAVSVLGVFAAAVNAQVNFDQGVSVQAAIEQAVNADLSLPEADKYISHAYYTRDCVGFSFGPGDNEIMSDKVRLQSTEYVRECYTTGNPPVQNCYERPGQTWRKTVQLNIKSRKLFPWENETFEACLEGPWMDLYVDEAAYKYSVKRIGNYDTLFELTPHNKIAMKPDVDGLEAGEFSYNAGTKKYTFKVNDKWAKEYAGEKVAIKVELYKDNPNWFATFKGEKEFPFDAAPSYGMTFAESELVIPDNSPDNNPVDNNSFKGPKKFYLKWGFKRIGAISKDTFIKKGKTSQVEVP